MIPRLSLGFLLLALPCAAASQPASNILSAGQLEGRWLLTLTPIPPGQGGSVSVRRPGGTDAAGPLTFQVGIQARGAGLRCVVAASGAAAKPAPCALRDGGLRLEVRGTGAQQGTVTFNLARSSAGLIAGDASIKAPILPIRAKIGTATLVRST